MKPIVQMIGSALGGVVVLVLALVATAAYADRLGEAIPDGGCVLCWDGDNQIGYSTSGKCKRGEAGVVSSSPVLCSGNDLTAGHPALEGLARWLVPGAWADATDPRYGDEVGCWKWGDLAPKQCPEPERWCGLAVVEEAHVGCPMPYDSHAYRYDADRMEREVARRTTGLFAPYSARVPASLHETDLEHVVARSEAHESGACFLSPVQKRSFANDTANAVLAFPRVNRVEKRAKDAGEWLPRHNREWFAWRYAYVKWTYSLSVDPRERDALAGVFGGRCPDFYH